MNSLLKKLRANPFWKSVGTLSAGQIISQCINLFSIPIISRIYSKNAYGDFGIVTSTATIIIGFIGFGIGSAIMAPKDNDESEVIFRAGILLQFILATVLSIGIIILMPWHTFFTTSIPYPVAVIVMYFYILLNVLSSYMNVYVNRLQKNKVLFFNPLIGAMCTLCITLPLGLLKFDSVGLYVASIISLTITNVHMFKHANPIKKMPRIKDIIYVIKKYKDFIRFQYPSNLMGTFTNQLPNQILSSNYGNAVLGDYSMCNKVFNLPFSLIASPIQTVYFRTAAQMFRDGDNLADFTFSLISKLMLIAMVPIVIVMGFGKEIFVFVLGSQWDIAGQLASILALQYLFSFCYSCVTYCRVAIGQQKINLFTSIVQLIVIVISLLVGGIYFKTLIGTITCFAVANTVLGLANIAVNFYCLKKHLLKYVLFSGTYCAVCLILSAIIKSVFKSISIK